MKKFQIRKCEKFHQVEYLAKRNFNNRKEKIYQLEKSKLRTRSKQRNFIQELDIVSKGLQNCYPPKLQIHNRTDTDVNCEILFQNSQTLIIRCTFIMSRKYVA